MPLLIIIFEKSVSLIFVIKKAPYGAFSHEMEAYCA